LAGVDRDEEKERIQRKIYDYCQSKGWHFPLIMRNDAEIGLAAALHQANGMLAISGTGSIVYGMTPDGKKHRTGGWGHLLGDEGSGYHIGLCSLQEVMHSYDGVRGPTLLTELILAACGVSSARDLKSYIYRPEVQKKEIASFAESCIRAAENVDDAAARIVRQAAADLSAQACALILKHEFYRTAPLGISGSIFRHSSLFRETFAKHIVSEYPEMKVTLSGRDPVWGAAELAMASVAKES
jgi:N-acetylglucosamine kinase-like BadF-type ATPase